MLALCSDFNARCSDYQDLLVNDNIDFIIDDNGVYETNLIQNETLKIHAPISLVFL